MVEVLTLTVTCLLSGVQKKAISPLMVEVPTITCILWVKKKAISPLIVEVLIVTCILWVRKKSHFSVDR